MPKTASQSVAKWSNNSTQAADDYTQGATSTPLDQAARAIAAKAIYASQVQAAITRDAYARGLQRSGKAGWLKGVQEKGAQNYNTGVGSDVARAKYVQNSARYDAARNAAASAPRGPKGSATNLNRVALVANALRAVKVAS